jgi:putative transposase
LSLFAYHANEGTIMLLAWVFLPNHYHVLVKVDDISTLGGVFKNVHGRTSYLWNKEDSTRGRKVWFRYSDRYMRNERHFYTTLNYIHFNPVKHGYVDSPYDWAWGSVHWYKRDKGVEWLRDLWSAYPLRDYGKGWDDL